MIIGGRVFAIGAPCALVGAGYFLSVAPCTEIGSARCPSPLMCQWQCGLGLLSFRIAQNHLRRSMFLCLRRVFANIVGRQPVVDQALIVGVD